MTNVEVGMRKWEMGSGNSEVGMGKWEVGMGNSECGSGTRRRPIRRDYAAAKDAEGGKKEGERLGW
jgi:hypothetical protein